MAESTSLTIEKTGNKEGLTVRSGSRQDLQQEVSQVIPSSLVPTTSQTTKTEETDTRIEKRTDHHTNSQTTKINGVPVTNVNGGPVPPGAKLKESHVEHLPTRVEVENVDPTSSTSRTTIKKPDVRQETPISREGYIVDNPYTLIDESGHVRLNSEGEQLVKNRFQEIFRSGIEQGLSAMTIEKNIENSLSDILTSDQLFRESGLRVKVTGGSITITEETSSSGYDKKTTTGQRTTDVYKVPPPKTPSINITELYGGKVFDVSDGKPQPVGDLELKGNVQFKIGGITVSADDLRNKSVISNINQYVKGDSRVTELTMTGEKFRALVEERTGKKLEDIDPHAFGASSDMPREGAYVALTNLDSLPHNWRNINYCSLNLLNAEMGEKHLRGKKITVITTTEATETEQYREEKKATTTEDLTSSTESEEITRSTYEGRPLQVEASLDKKDRSGPSTNIYDTKIPSFEGTGVSGRIEPRIEYGTGGTRFNLVGAVDIPVGERTRIGIHTESNSAIPQSNNVVGLGVYQKVGSDTVIVLQGNYFGLYGDVPLGTKKTEVSATLRNVDTGEKIAEDSITIKDPKSGQAFNIQGVVGQNFTLGRDQYGDTRTTGSITGTVGYRVWNSEGLPNTIGAGVRGDVEHKFVNNPNTQIGVKGGVGLTYTPGQQDGDFQWRGYVGVFGQLGKNPLRPAVSADYRIDEIPEYSKKVTEQLQARFVQMNPSQKDVVENARVRVVLPNSDQRRLLTTASVIGGAPNIAEAPIPGDPTSKFIMMTLSFKDRNSGAVSQYVSGEVVPRDFQVDENAVGNMQREIQGKLAKIEASTPLEEAIAQVLPPGFGVDNRPLETIFAEKFGDALQQAQLNARVEVIGIDEKIRELFPENAIFRGEDGKWYVIPVVNYRGELIGYGSSPEVLNRSNNLVNQKDIIPPGPTKDKVQDEVINPHFAKVEGGLRVAPGFESLGLQGGGNSRVGDKVVPPGTVFKVPVEQPQKTGSGQPPAQPFLLPGLNPKEQDELNRNLEEKYNPGPGYNDKPQP